MCIMCAKQQCHDPFVLLISTENLSKDLVSCSKILSYLFVLSRTAICDSALSPTLWKTWIRKSTHTHTQNWVHTHTHTQIHTRTYKYTHAHTRTHTHTHTHNKHALRHVQSEVKISLSASRKIEFWHVSKRIALAFRFIKTTFFFSLVLCRCFKSLQWPWENWTCIRLLELIFFWNSWTTTKRK